MKSIIAIAFLLVTGLACKEIRQNLLPSFTVNIPDIKLSIPAIPFKQNREVPVGALKIPINMDSTIRANTAGAFGQGAVSSVKVKKIVFLLRNATPENNLSNFESGRMRIFADTDTAATDIVSVTFPHNYSDSLVITPVNSPEISSYLRGSALSYNIFWKNRRPTSQRLNLIIKVSLSVQ